MIPFYTSIMLMAVSDVVQVRSVALQAAVINPPGGATVLTLPEPLLYM